MWQKGSVDSAFPGRVDTMFKLAVLFVRNSVWQGPGHFDSVCDRKPNRQVEGLQFDQKWNLTVSPTKKIRKKPMHGKSY